MEEFFSSSVLSIVIKAFSDDFLLRNLVELTDPVSQNSVSSRWEFGVSIVVDVVKVIHNELDLIFVGQGCSECLELKLLDLLCFTVADALYDSF